MAVQLKLRQLCYLTMQGVQAGFTISTYVIFSLLIRCPKDQFYFYFSFEEDYNNITFILPLNGHSVHISKDILFFIQ